MTPRTFRNLAKFARLLVATRDIDPIYDLLRRIIRNRSLGPVEAHWLIFCYLTFYNTSSAWALFSEFSSPIDVDADRPGLIRWAEANRERLRINTERRGLRGGRWVDPLLEYVTRTGEGVEWLITSPSADPGTAYEVLWTRVQTLPQVGRWAAFKWLDLLQNVLGYPIAPPDMRMEYCSGPRKALEDLYDVEPHHRARQDKPYIRWLDEKGAELRDQLKVVGVPLEWDTLETVLCNWHSTTEGRYYVGHDIDEHLRDTRGGLGDPGVWMEARAAIFDHRLLGEFNGWNDVRSDLLGAYKERGIVYCDLER